MDTTTTRAWLYVRGPESIRIVIDGSSVAVYGPGRHFSHSRFGEEMTATLHQAAVEHSLVLDGWTLEQLTTERRARRDHPKPSPAEDRRGGMRLVRDRRDL